MSEPDHGPEYWRDVRLHVAEASAEAAAPQPGPPAASRIGARVRVRVALAAAAVAAVAAVALLAGLPRTPGPQSVSAAEVLNRALAAYSSGHTWQADLAVKFFASDMWETPSRYDVVRLPLIADADGSYRLTWYEGTPAGRRVTGVEAYDAKDRQPAAARDGRRSWHVVTSYPLGPPDDAAGSLRAWTSARRLRAWRRRGTLRLDETVVDGRPAWTVTCTKGRDGRAPVVQCRLARLHDQPWTSRRGCRSGSRK